MTARDELWDIPVEDPFLKFKQYHSLYWPAILKGMATERERLYYAPKDSNSLQAYLRTLMEYGMGQRLGPAETINRRHIADWAKIAARIGVQMYERSGVINLKSEDVSEKRLSGVTLRTSSNPHFQDGTAIAIETDIPFAGNYVGLPMTLYSQEVLPNRGVIHAHTGLLEDRMAEVARIAQVNDLVAMSMNDRSPFRAIASRYGIDFPPVSALGTSLEQNQLYNVIMKLIPHIDLTDSLRLQEWAAQTTITREGTSQFPITVHGAGEPVSCRFTFGYSHLSYGSGARLVGVDRADLLVTPRLTPSTDQFVLAETALGLKKMLVQAGFPV